MSTLYLGLAIVLEVCGTLCMKASYGFTRVLPVVGMCIFYVLCFGSLTIAIKKIDVGVAYAVWSGIGTALIAIAGVLLFKESMSVPKVLSIALIIIGVVGVQLSGTAH